jgi:LDH2 family malate/lactate/ureidoglycolate dehydrogenase
MATTTVAFGKVFKAWMSGEPEIPAGWAVDAAGVPTTSTEAAMKGWPMPLGGYKGYGLAMFVEILCGVLAGGGFGTDLGGIRFSNQRLRVGQTFIAIDVSRFIPVPEFESRMERLIEMMKTATPADGFDEVLVAGEPEWRMQELRRREGIPVPAGVWEKLLEAAERLGVQVPAVEAS